MKTMKYIIPTLFASLLLSGCAGIQVKKNGGNSNQNNTTNNQVSKSQWDSLFNLSNIALKSNFKIHIDYPTNSWSAGAEIDYGRFLILNTGLSSAPEGSDPVEQRNYQYYQMKSVQYEELYYDHYEYKDYWVVTDGSENIDSFFQGYGLFALDYSDFTYNSNDDSYHGTLAGYGYDTTIKFENNVIKKIAYQGKGDIMYYTFYDYGEVSVKLPTPGSTD